MSSQWAMVIGYLVLVLLALVAWLREDSRATDADAVWPSFWLFTAGFLAVMAFGRVGDNASLLSDLARDRVVEGGWYGTRRPVQAMAIAALGAAWLLIVGLACRKIPERLPRYLPMGLMTLTLAAYAAVRVVSLHQVDALLHRREIVGVQVGTLIEVILLVATGLATLWVPVAQVQAHRPSKATS